MIKEDKLDIYNNSAIIIDKKTPSKIISWITILIILSLIVIIFSFIKFNVYKSYFCYIDKDFCIISNLEYSDFPVDKSNNLYIKGKKYSYDVIGIKNNNLVLKIDLDSSMKIQNNIIAINILKNRTSLIKIIRKKIKKGFGL